MMGKQVLNVKNNQSMDQVLLGLMKPSQRNHVCKTNLIHAKLKKWKLLAKTRMLRFYRFFSVIRIIRCYKWENFLKKAPYLAKKKRKCIKQMLRIAILPSRASN